MPQDAFGKNWTNITLNQPDTFQKVDLVVKNPAPAHIPIEKVVAQLENFFINALGLKVYASATGCQAVGQVLTKPAVQSSFPANPNEMAKSESIPLMIEVQFYPDIQTSEFRLSLRSTANKMIASQVINFIKFFMGV